MRNKRTETSDVELVSLVEMDRIFEQHYRLDTKRILLYLAQKHGWAVSINDDGVWVNLKEKG